MDGQRQEAGGEVGAKTHKKVRSPAECAKNLWITEVLFTNNGALLAKGDACKRSNMGFSL